MAAAWCCGAGRYWLGNCIAVKMLRRTGYRGPIQLWADGPHDDTLAHDGVEIREVARFRERHPARILRGWENKTYAILHSGFERVFFCDADAYPVASIQHWLDNVVTFSYWRNFDVTWGNTKWDWYGEMAIPGNRTPPVQGGQIFVHVKNAWRELWTAHWINQHSDYFYSHQYGDECSWRVAFALTGARANLLGLAAWNGVGCTCSEAIIHRYYAKIMSNATPRWCDWLPREAGDPRVVRGTDAERHHFAAAARRGEGEGSGAMTIHLPSVKTFVYTIERYADRRQRMAAMLDGLGFSDWHFVYGTTGKPHYWQNVHSDYVDLFRAHAPFLVLEDDSTLTSHYRPIWNTPTTRSTSMWAEMSGRSRTPIGRAIGCMSTACGAATPCSSSTRRRRNGSAGYLDRRRNVPIDVAISDELHTLRAYLLKRPIWYQQDGHNDWDTQFYYCEPEPVQRPDTTSPFARRRARERRLR